MREDYIESKTEWKKIFRYSQDSSDGLFIRKVKYTEEGNYGLETLQLLTMVWNTEQIIDVTVEDLEKLLRFAKELDAKTT